MSAAGNERNLLLGLPGDLLSRILTFKANFPTLLLLWLTGSKALQARLRRWTKKVDINTVGEREITRRATLPACLTEFSHLEALKLCAYNVELGFAGVLKKMNPGLKSLNFELPLGHNIFKPREPLSAPRPEGEESQVDVEAHTAYEGGIDASRGGRGRQENGREQRGQNVVAVGRGGGGRGFRERRGVSRPVFATLSENSLVDLSETFPHLETFKLSFYHANEEANCGCDLRFPASLLTLRGSLPQEEGRLLNFVAHLPRGMTSLDGNDEPAELSLELCAVLPPSLTFLDCSIQSKESVDALRALPSSLTSFGCLRSGTLRTWNQGLAQAIPPMLRELVIMFEGPKEELKHFPTHLTHLELWDTLITAVELRALPRGITQLSCCLSSEGQKYLSQDFPPQLIDLNLLPSASDEQAKALNDVVTLFPASLRQLTLNDDIDSGIYNLLPRGLQELNLRRHSGNVDPERFSLPPRLQHLTIGRLHNYGRRSPPSEGRLKDMDAWTKEDSLGIASGLITLPFAPEEILPPFPYHLLPRTLTYLSHETRPTPISALQHLPLLTTLYLLDLVEDAQFDPNDPILVAKANELRLFGQTITRRAELASSPLTSVSAEDLLPKSLKRVSIHGPRERIEGVRPGYVRYR